MKKSYLNLVLALTVVAGLFAFSSEAKADELGTGWNVNYDGSRLTSDFDAATTKADIKQAMPGDTITYTIDYSNSSNKTADFYLESSVLASLESNTNANGGAYAYSVTYNTGAGETAIYDSEVMGGDDQGLLQAAGTNNSYFYIGQLAAGKKGTVKVTVVLDGNSQDNSYMSALAQLGIRFGVEDTRVITNTTRNTVTYTIPGGTQVVQVIDDTLTPLAGPRTGDSMIMLIGCAVALFAGVMLIIWYLALTRREEEEGA